jgi:hypothetical protein
MDNKYAETLADEYGQIDYEIKLLEEKKKAIREELLNHVQDIPVIGLRWTVTKSESTARRLDADLVRLALGERVRQFERPVTTTKLMVKQTKVLGRTAEGV